LVTNFLITHHCSVITSHVMYFISTGSRTGGQYRFVFSQPSALLSLPMGHVACTADVPLYATTPVRCLCRPYLPLISYDATVWWTDGRLSLL